jgi:hypothetical protein
MYNNIFYYPHTDACVGKGNQTEFFDDGNCVTFWDCEDFTPHPVCCPEGQGYDAVRGCINNPLCKDICPDQYKPGLLLLFLYMFLHLYSNNYNLFTTRLKIFFLCVAKLNIRLLYIDIYIVEYNIEFNWTWTQLSNLYWTRRKPSRTSNIGFCNCV